MEGSCEWVIEYSSAQPTRGGPPVSGLGREKKILTMLRKATQCLGIGWILWKDLSNGK